MLRQQLLASVRAVFICCTFVVSATRMRHDRMLDSPVGTTLLRIAAALRSICKSRVAG
jgi:hypothetical protein